MTTFYAKLRMIFNRDERALFTIQEFAHQNKNLLIIVADPKTDRMFVAHQDRFVNAQIKSPDGKKTHVVRDVVRYSQFHKSIDMFITSLVETLKLPLWKGGANQFYQFIDGAIFNIAKSLRKPPKPQEPGAVPSPFVEAREGRDIKNNQ